MSLGEPRERSRFNGRRLARCPSIGVVPQTPTSPVSWLEVGRRDELICWTQGVRRVSLPDTSRQRPKGAPVAGEGGFIGLGKQCPQGRFEFALGRPPALSW